MPLFLIKTVDGCSFWMKQLEVVVEADTAEDARERTQIEAYHYDPKGAACLGWLNDSASSCLRIQSIPLSLKAIHLRADGTIRASSLEAREPQDA